VQLRVLLPQPRVRLLQRGYHIRHVRRIGHSGTTSRPAPRARTVILFPLSRRSPIVMSGKPRTPPRRPWRPRRREHRRSRPPGPASMSSGPVTA